VHRDLKGENVLVDLETGDLLVLGQSLANLTGGTRLTIRFGSCYALLGERTETDDMLRQSRFPREFCGGYDCFPV